MFVPEPSDIGLSATAATPSSAALSSSSTAPNSSTLSGRGAAARGTPTLPTIPNVSSGSRRASSTIRRAASTFGSCQLPMNSASGRGIRRRRASARRSLGR